MIRGRDDRQGRIGGAITLTLVCTLAHAAAAQQAESMSRNCGACRSGPQVGLHATSQTAQDTVRRRAIQYSDAYYVRLKIHQIGSYIEFPLFAAEYFVGEKVLKDEQADPARRLSLRGAHGAIASGLELLFAVNTITGGWNLIDARHDPSGRTRRWLHSLAMLAADGGFVATAGSARSARGGGTSANQHRTLAIGSMGLATAATLMMWLWNN